MINAPKPSDNIIDRRDLSQLLREKEQAVEALFDEWLTEIVKQERESRQARDQPFDEEVLQHDYNEVTWEDNTFWVRN